MIFRSIVVFSVLVSLVDATTRGLKKGKKDSKNTKTRKKSKGTSTKDRSPTGSYVGIDIEDGTNHTSTKDRSPTGSYTGIDIEDGTNQFLSMYCENGLCNVRLDDIVFTTCVEVTGNSYLGGVAIADGIPEDSLDNFDLDLYCLQKGKLEIDLDKDTPVTTLKGDLIFLEKGVIRRTSTGFTYFSNFRGDLSADKPSVPHNGNYYGLDTEDGSTQELQIFCEGGLCDVTLADSSFSTCSAITGDLFFGGVATATNVREETLDNFKLNLYCLGINKTQFDSTPTSTLTGNILGLKDGIVRRMATGFTYFKFSDKNGLKGDQIDTGNYMNSASTTNGSRSSYKIHCANKKCDVELTKDIFPTCLALTGIKYLTGVALATGIDQDSLDNFSLNLYCAKGFGVDIDLKQPTSIISSGLEVLEDGILRHIDSGARYFNYYFGSKVNKSFSNGIYFGQSLDSGNLGLRSIYCKNKMCDIAASAVSFNPCTIQNGVTNAFNGVAYMKDVPEDSLGAFDIDLYCLKPAQQVDYGVTVPTKTMAGGMISVGNGIVKAFEPADITYFKGTGQ